MLRTATYIFDGRGKSYGAIDAEERGHFTATSIGKHLGIPSKFIRRVLRPSEWHHTGLYAARTDYYCLREITDEELKNILSLAYRRPETRTRKFEACKALLALERAER